MLLGYLLTLCYHGYLVLMINQLNPYVKTYELNKHEMIINTYFFLRNIVVLIFLLRFLVERMRNRLSIVFLNLKFSTEVHRNDQSDKSCHPCSQGKQDFKKE